MDKNKKATINHVNEKDNKSFHFTVTVALNHEEIKKDPQQNSEKKHFQSEKNNWTKIKKNNVSIALNVFYAKYIYIYIYIYICIYIYVYIYIYYFSC